MKNGRLRRAAVVVTGLALAGGVAACSSSGGGSSPGSGSSSVSSSVAQLNSMTDAQLYPEAKKEGKLTWYTSMPEADLPVITKAFEKAYPGISVSALYLTGQTPVTRVETEARSGSISADVVSGSGDAVLLEQAGLIDTSYKPKDAPKLPTGLNMPPGLASDRIITNVITYNPKAVAAAGLKPPTSFQDLAQPQWKGKFYIDPTTADLLNALGPSEGDSTVLTMIKSLGNNSPVFVTSHSLAASQVAAGTVLAAASSYGQTAVVNEEKDPSTTNFVNPSPLPVLVSEIGIVKNDPDPAAGRLFMDWMISKAGQDVVTSLGLTSVRTDVTNNPKVWDPAESKPVFEDVSKSTAQTNKELQEWQSALHYSGTGG
jgi:iron(III) transport system substrate-binding protein